MKIWFLNAEKPCLIFLSSLVMFLFTCLCASAIALGIHVVSKQGKQIYLYEDYHALVIGVSNYKWWPKLPYARNDAKQVAERLKKMGYKVKLVLDPTSRQLKAALNDMVYAMGMAKDRAILLYYAGHGETETLADNTKMGYLIPKDCPLLKQDPSSFTSHAVSMRDMESVSLKIRSKHVLMLFDSCFSGSLFGLVRTVPEDITEKSSLPVRQYITAGREDEQVPDKSIFKRSFLVGLEGDADLTADGYITGSELGMYLSNKVVNYTHGRQHPQYGKINNPNLDRGDFIFVPLKRRQMVKPEPEIREAEKKTSGSEVVDIERTKEDTSVEIVFWESIRDSNDCEMFEQYLRGFPNGKFSRLAKIHMEKLACDDSYREGASGIREGRAQEEIALIPRMDPKPDSRVKLAVFPFYFSAFYFGGDPDVYTIEILSHTLSDNKSLVPIYSYYNLGSRLETKKINQSIIDYNVADSLWLKHGAFTLDRKPNIDLVTKLGHRLNVDLVLAGAFIWNDSNHDWNITYYLIDVQTKEVYSKTNLFSYTALYGNLKSFTEKFFDAYDKDKFK